MTRRDFAGLGAGLLVQAPNSDTFLTRLARKELTRGLGRIYPGNTTQFQLLVEPAAFRESDAYSIERRGGGLTLRAVSDRALCYAVFDFLERQGMFYGIDGESMPFDPPKQMALPTEGAAWQAKPRFAVRGLLPWPDFLNCISVYNEEDFRAYFESMLRMRFNMFGMHVYTGANQWAESYLSFEFAGAGHLAYLDSSASNRWGYLPERTSRFGMGAADFYDSEVFGADATRLGRDNWEIADRSRAMLRKSLDYAHKLGIQTGIGFEPYQIPDEILRALPPEVKTGNTRSPKFNIESVTAKKMLEARLANLLESYPDVDNVWLWEDEGMNWDSRKSGIPLSTTPFLQAHDFLKRNAPTKRLVLSGWGGVARHFEYFHQKLPGDIVFSCLSDTLGWDPVNEVFGKLDGRERWPIPWLEDDPAMWLPQFHVHRFKRDLDLAQQYDCQGMIGIHWRHRIVDPTAGYMARYSWDNSLSPAAYYDAYASTQAAQPRAAKLASVLDDADRKRKLLSTGTNEVKDGHVVQHEFSGDYNEAFTFWNDYEPDPKVVASQKEVAAALAALAAGAASPFEREKIDYLAKHVGLLVPYTEAWIQAHRLNLLLKDKKPGTVELWLKLAPNVRQTMLAFQSIVATRNDLGTLASMQNKFVRLALERLPLSLQEQAGEMPRDVAPAVKEALKPEAGAARLIVPTRPSMLAQGEKVRLTAIALGSEPPRTVTLYVRSGGAWSAAPARLMGRRTWEAILGPLPARGPAAEYYLTAAFPSGPCSAPLDAPVRTYPLTLAL
jgi:hypothetical protein